jgi:hypothetical protein
VFPACPKGSHNRDSLRKLPELAVFPDRLQFTGAANAGYNGIVDIHVY